MTSRRNGLFGLLGTFAATGLATGAPEPPINPLVEGREPNPVVREFYETEKPVESHGAGPVVPARSNFDLQKNSAGWVLIAAGTWDVILDQLTFPLGTARMGEQQEKMEN